MLGNQTRIARRRSEASERRHPFLRAVTTTTVAAKRDPCPRRSRRRSAGGADETPQEPGSFSLDSRFVGFDEDGGFPANIAASEASNQTQRAQRVRQSNTVPPMGFEPMLERV